MTGPKRTAEAVPDPGVPSAAARGPDSAPRVDAFGIGVQKAATTWWFRGLASHPQLRTADPGRLGTESGSLRITRKELNFFNHHWERGFAWYHRMFEFGPWKTLEFSTLYFHDRDVPRRIHAYNPEARLLLSLRDPVERAYSQHRHEVRKGRLPPELHDFRAALRHNPAYLEQGRYATHLERWLEWFDRDRILVVDHEEIRRRPEAVMRRSYAFLGLDSGHEPKELGERINVPKEDRSRWLGRAMRAAWGVAGEPIRRVLRRTGVPSRARRANEVVVRERRVPPLDEETRRELAARFADENRRLGRLLGRDFSHWS